MRIRERNYASIHLIEERRDTSVYVYRVDKSTWPSVDPSGRSPSTEMIERYHRWISLVEIDFRCRPSREKRGGEEEEGVEIGRRGAMRHRGNDDQ